MVPGNHSQTYDLMLVVQTETNVLLLDNKIKFWPAVLIFGSRSMVALIVGDFTVCEDSLETILLQIFAHTKNSE